jgi:hypothetical protein
MCHYAQLTFPEPAVMLGNCVLHRLVVVEPVKPAPIVIVPAVCRLNDAISTMHRLPPAAAVA